MITRNIPKCFPFSPNWWHYWLKEVLKNNADDEKKSISLKSKSIIRILCNVYKSPQIVVLYVQKIIRNSRMEIMKTLT